MLDITLTASLLKAVPVSCQVLFIGDPDQLPSIGAGSVLRDLLSSGVVPHSRLTKIFRQAEESDIISKTIEEKKSHLVKNPPAKQVALG